MLLRSRGRKQSYHNKVQFECSRTSFSPSPTTSKTTLEVYFGGAKIVLLCFGLWEFSETPQCFEAWHSCHVNRMPHSSCLLFCFVFKEGKQRDAWNKWHNRCWGNIPSGRPGERWLIQSHSLKIVTNTIYIIRRDAQIPVSCIGSDTWVEYSTCTRWSHDTDTGCICMYVSILLNYLLYLL